MQCDVYIVDKPRYDITNIRLLSIVIKFLIPTQFLKSPKVQNFKHFSHVALHRFAATIALWRCGLVPSKSGLHLK